MLALIYLGLAIALGDVLCRRFYRFVSIPHRWAAAVLVGVVFSTWFTYLAVLAFSHLAEPLLLADLLFFVVAAGAIFWSSRKARKAEPIPPSAPGSSMWDWMTLGALFAVTCVLLIGTLYVNKQGRIRLSETRASDFASQLAIAQNFAVGHNFQNEFAHHAGHRAHYQFPLYFQAGNLEFLGLNLAWSVDVLNLLSLASLLALVMALGELLFNSRVVGRLGAVLFLFHGSIRQLTNFLSSDYSHHAETWGFWKQIAFGNQQTLSFVVGVFLLALIFLVDCYRRRGPAKSFVFSGLLVAAVPLWNALVFVVTTIVLFCLLAAYGLWWLSKKTPYMLGRVVAGALTACILVGGAMDLFAVYSGARVEVQYDDESLVRGLVFRRSVIYKVPSFSPSRVAVQGSLKLPVTAFQGGHGNGSGQFDSPRAIATDSAGNIFVADTGNGRIEKFSPNGGFVTRIEGFEAPSGIAIDRAGNIYVAEIGSKHCVQKLRSDGTFIAKWAPALYGPRKIAIGGDDSIYVVDSGRNRIVKFSPDGQVLVSWGSEGSGDGQFRGVTSVAVDPDSTKVYVTDPINSRIDVFDSSGKFLSKWSVPEWGKAEGYEDLVIDSQRGRLYASSANMDTILVFDLQGNRTGTLTPTPPDKLEAPSALALAKDKLLVLNVAPARVCAIDLQNR